MDDAWAEGRYHGRGVVCAAITFYSGRANLDLFGLRRCPDRRGHTLRNQTGGNGDCRIRRLPDRFTRIEKFCSLDHGRGRLYGHIRVRGAISLYRSDGWYYGIFRRPFCTGKISNRRTSWRG